MGGNAILRGKTTYTTQRFQRSPFFTTFARKLRAMLLYGFGIRCYGALLWVARLWHAKARLWVQGRHGWEEKLRNGIKRTDGDRTVWFHCASLGEFEQGRRVMEQFMAQHPGWRLVVSFFSPSGYTVRQNYPLASCVCYLPLDTARNAGRFLDIVRPSLAFFVKYELWYNYLRLLHQQGIPTFLISAIFRPSQPFFRWWGRAYRRWLGYFTRVFVQDAESLALLNLYGISNAQVAGDTRFDRVHEAAQHAEPLAQLSSFFANRHTLVAGSTWPPDEARLVEVAKRLPDEWCMVLIPHEIDARRIAQWRESIGRPSLLYSQLDGQCASAEYRILVVDTVGLLLRLYQYATLAYVGGGFGVGIHNTLEPAAFGVGVVFGPNYQRFREAVGLVDTTAALPVDRVEKIPNQLLALMASPEQLTSMGQAAARYVQIHTGATERILGVVGETLGEKPEG